MAELSNTGCFNKFVSLSEFRGGTCHSPFVVVTQSTPAADGPALVQIALKLKREET